MFLRMRSTAWVRHSDTERTTAAAEKRWFFFIEDDLTDIRVYAVIQENLWFEAVTGGHFKFYNVS